MIADMAWYKEWFGAEYQELYAHRDGEEAERHADFVLAHLPGTPHAVLDLACGAGRHTAALRRRGIRVVGVDLSLWLLAQVPRQPSVAGDMRTLPFAAGAFTWALNFFTSFGYFESERENFRVLEEITRVLAPGGRFLIDFLNRERVLADLTPHEVQATPTQNVTIERWYDAATQRVNKRIRVERPGQAPRTFRESVRAYSPDEVTIGLRWAGLEAEQLYGNFQGEPFQRDSQRLIIIGRKAT